MFVLYLYSIHDLSFYPAIECLSDWTFKSCCYWWTKSHISFRTTHQPQNMMQTRMDGTSQLCLKNVAHILNFDKSLLIVVILGKLPWTKTWNFWRHRRFRPFRPAATVGTTVLGAVGASAVIRLWPGCSGWKAAPQTKEPKSNKNPNDASFTMSNHVLSDSLSTWYELVSFTKVFLFTLFVWWGFCLLGTWMTMCFPPPGLAQWHKGLRHEWCAALATHVPYGAHKEIQQGFL